MIKEANVTVMVASMQRAVDFYSGTLGFKVKARFGDQFAQLEGPKVVIALHPITSDRPMHGGQESLSIGFAVDDLDKEMAVLKARGVNFSRITDDTQVRLAFFTDPDGTPLYLSQSKWG